MLPLLSRYAQWTAILAEALEDVLNNGPSYQAGSILRDFRGWQDHGAEPLWMDAMP